jgi:hypothetical protein
MLIAAPNIQICTLAGLPEPDHKVDPNGGSARGYQELPAPLAIPTTAEQAAARAVCLCIASARRYRPHMPRSARLSPGGGSSCGLVSTGLSERARLRGAAHRTRQQARPARYSQPLGAATPK